MNRRRRRARGRTARTALIAIVGIALAGSGWTQPAVEDDTPVTIQAATVLIQYAAGQEMLTLSADEALTITDASGKHMLPPGTWRLHCPDARPAAQRFHVFGESIPPSETVKMSAAMAAWEAKGYAPEAHVIGKKLRTSRGGVIDNREFWLSIARCDSADEAERIARKLAEEMLWTWVRPETLTSGSGTITLLNQAGQAVLAVAGPATFTSVSPITIAVGKPGPDAPAGRSYPAPVMIEIGPDGRLEAYGKELLEQYLKGVLAAEMPALWPAEALKAQAVAARSEVLANLAGKHRLEGFDFCVIEHCRAFKGLDGRTKPTDAAVEATRGEVLIGGGRIATTVFAANCGGWTEDNDAVWSGPPNPVLRGLPDFPLADTDAVNRPPSGALAQWLNSPSTAYCAGDAQYFRWIRSYESGELSKILNKKYPIGELQAIEPGERGVSGRLKWVRIVGTRGADTIHRELDIRLALGGLPSAMFIIDVQRNADGSRSYTFRGGGRGHGVGLCQQGARGMALQGFGYPEIVRHYFAGVEVMRLQ